MDLIIALLVFVLALIFCISTGISSVLALAIGLLCFFLVGIKRGFKAEDLIRMTLKGAKKSLGVLRVFVLIGLITGLWRAGGVIAYFVDIGFALITPKSFILVTFLLSCVLAYALGSSFGVCGTVGVVMMAIARAGGVNPLIVAGAVMSASYLGERVAPTSSCLHLISMLTKTDVLGNVKTNARTMMPAFLLSIGIYGGLSVANPLLSQAAGDGITGQFALSPWLIIPAVLMILLPVLKVDVLYSMMASAIASFVLTIVLQDMSLVETLKVCFFGFAPIEGGGSEIFAGGGIFSMISVSGIVVLSSSYSGIFEGTRMLDDVERVIEKTGRKIGLLPTCLLTGLTTCAVFCSQTIAIILSHQLIDHSYKANDANSRELMSDISNTSVTISAMVPWCAAAAVPIEMLNVSPAVALYSFFLYLMPISWLLLKKRYMKKLR